MIWQGEGRGQRSEVPLSQNTIMQLMPCGDSIAAGTADPAFGLIAADGEKQVWQEGVTTDMRGKNATPSRCPPMASASASAWGLAESSPSCSISPPSASATRRNPHRALRRPEPLASPSRIGRTSYAELNGKPIALKDHESSRALAIAPDASRFVLGTDYLLRAYRADGDELWQKAVPEHRLVA